MGRSFSPGFLHHYCSMGIMYGLSQGRDLSEELQRSCIAAFRKKELPAVLQEG